MRLAIAPGAKVFFDPGDPARGLPRAVRRRARGARPRRPGRRAAGRRRRARRGARARPRAGLPRCLSPARSGSPTPTSGSCPEADERGRPGPDPARLRQHDARRARRARGARRRRAGDRRRARRRPGARRAPHAASACATGASSPSGAPATRTRWTAIDVVLDTGTAVLDATGMIVTPGGVDPHVHWLSPAGRRHGAGRRADDARDPGLRPGLEPRHQPGRGARRDLGGARGPRGQRRAARARLLVAARAGRGGAARRRRRAEDPRGRRRRAGADPLRAATSPTATTSSSRSTPTASTRRSRSRTRSRAFGGRTIHAFHIEGCGGGHAPDLLDLAGRERVLTSSTSPTVPFGAGAEAEHLAMVAAVHVLAPGDAGGRLDRAAPPRAAADDGGRGRAARPRRDRDALLRLAGHGPDRRGLPARAPERRRDEARARRRARARATTRASCATSPRSRSTRRSRTGWRGHVGSLELGQARRRRAVVAAVRGRAAGARAQERDRRVGRVGRRERDDDARRAGARAAPDRRRGRGGGAALARVPGRARRWTRSCRRRGRARRSRTAAS